MSQENDKGVEDPGAGEGAGDDSVLSFLEGDLVDPESLGLPALEEGKSFKGQRPIKDYLEALPKDVQQNLINMQREFHKSKREQAELRKENARIQKESQENTKRISDALEQIEREEAEIAAKAEPVDLWSEDGMSFAMQREARKSFVDIHKPIVQQSNQAEMERKAAEFVASKPEFESDEFKTDVLDILTKSIDAKMPLTLEQAYLISKGRASESAAFSKKVAAEEKDEARRSSILAGRSGARMGARETVPDLEGVTDPREIYAIVEAHSKGLARPQMKPKRYWES